jgi:Holliday junction resolvase
MNSKGKGARNERRSMKLLESLGYRCCRSAASLGCWDVVAIGTADVILIQVKSNSWPSEIEMESLREFRVPPGVRRLVHRWRDRQRLPDVREL